MIGSLINRLQSEKLKLVKDYTIVCPLKTVKKETITLTKHLAFIRFSLRCNKPVTNIGSEVFISILTRKMHTK